MLRPPSHLCCLCVQQGNTYPHLGREDWKKYSVHKDDRRKIECISDLIYLMALQIMLKKKEMQVLKSGFYSPSQVYLR